MSQKKYISIQNDNHERNSYSDLLCDTSESAYCTVFVAKVCRNIYIYIFISYISIHISKEKQKLDPQCDVLCDISPYSDLLCDTSVSAHLIFIAKVWLNRYICIFL